MNYLEIKYVSRDFVPAIAVEDDAEARAAYDIISAAISASDTSETSVITITINGSVSTIRTRLIDAVGLSTSDVVEKMEAKARARQEAYQQQANTMQGCAVGPSLNSAIPGILR